MCVICGWIFDEAKGAPEDGIEPQINADIVSILLLFIKCWHFKCEGEVYQTMMHKIKVLL